jgi:hypothetical protein
VFDPSRQRGDVLRSPQAWNLSGTIAAHQCRAEERPHAGQSTRIILGKIFGPSQLHIADPTRPVLVCRIRGSIDSSCRVVRGLLKCFNHELDVAPSPVRLGWALRATNPAMCTSSRKETVAGPQTPNYNQLDLSTTIAAMRGTLEPYGNSANLHW